VDGSRQLTEDGTAPKKKIKRLIGLRRGSECVNLARHILATKKRRESLLPGKCDEMGVVGVKCRTQDHDEQDKNLRSGEPERGGVSPTRINSEPIVKIRNATPKIEVEKT